MWCNIAEIDDTDMKIIVYRLARSNHITLQIWDKIPKSDNNYELRNTYVSSGDPKYNYMPGFGDFSCEDVKEETDKQLDDILGQSN